jgi:DNA-binding transcriptional regulator/RsmH inhibitor MraZ
LKEFAQIDKQVVIVGSLEYIEIWDVERYHQYLDYLEKNGEAIAESIDDSSSRTTD